eukprot:scaffold93311_cov31-Tisochrysis_lutea.AAC.2
MRSSASIAQSPLVLGCTELDDPGAGLGIRPTRPAARVRRARECEQPRSRHPSRLKYRRIAFKGPSPAALPVGGVLKLLQGYFSGYMGAGRWWRMRRRTEALDGVRRATGAVMHRPLAATRTAVRIEHRLKASLNRFEANRDLTPRLTSTYFRQQRRL